MAIEVTVMAEYITVALGVLKTDAIRRILGCLSTVIPNLFMECLVRTLVGSWECLRSMDEGNKESETIVQQ